MSVLPLPDHRRTTPPPTCFPPGTAVVDLETIGQLRAETFEPWLLVADVAGHQRHVVGRRQALACGLTERQIDRKVASGEWLVVARGVYCMRGVPFEFAGRLTAAAVARPTASVCRRAAAAWMACPTFGPCKPELVVATHRSVRTRIATVHRSDDIDRVVIDRIPVTSPAQTIVDLAGTTTIDRLHKAAAHLISTGQLDLQALEDRVRRAIGAGVAGVERLRQVLDGLEGAGAAPASVLEAELHAGLRAAGFTGWTAQAPAPWVGPHDPPEYVDVLFAVPRVIVEADGRAWHTRIDDFERDRRRDNLAATAGYQVLRFTSAMLRNDLAACLAQIRTTLDARS